MIDQLVDEPAGSAPSSAPAGDLELGYQVQVDAFSGPLDLLLYLVRRTQVDIAEIPIALIADQFIATVRSWQDLDLDVAGDFILMAATLLEIKSRMIMPPAEGEEASEDGDDEVFDPRSGLIQQLLAYRRFKVAVQCLTALEEEQAARVPRQLREIIPEDPDEVEGYALDNADPYLLFRTWEGVQARISGLGPRTVFYDDVPIEERMNALAATLQATREARLSWLFESVPQRIGKVGTLVAVLECVRQRIVEAIQHEQYGEVFLRFREPAERDREPSQPPEEAPEAKRRRRRLPLVTYHGPLPGESAGDAAAEGDGESEEEVEEVLETDEQRFMRELNESCDLDAVLARGVDIEASFAGFLAARQAPAEEPDAPAAQGPTAGASAHGLDDPGVAAAAAPAAATVGETAADASEDDGGPRAAPGPA